MTASEMEQKLKSFRKRDYRVLRHRQWWFWWQSLRDCSSRILRIWIASSSEDRSCSHEYKKQGKQCQRPSSTLWFSMVCQWGMKGSLYRKALTRQRTSQSWGKRLQNCHESTAQRHKRQRGSVVLAVKSDLKKTPKKVNRFVCVWAPWKICQGLQEEEDSTMQQVWWERSPRLGFAKKKRWSRTWVSGNGSNIGFTRRRTQGSSHPAGMLVDSGCTDHTVTKIDAFLGFVPIHSVVRNPNREASRVVVRGCVRISITSNKGEFEYELKSVLWVPDYSSNLLSVSRCTEWGHSFTLGKGNSCMKPQKGTWVKLTHDINLCYTHHAAFLEFKMTSNSVKLDLARKWHRRLGHLNQVDVLKNAPETVGEVDDVCNVCALA